MIAEAEAISHLLLLKMSIKVCLRRRVYCKALLSGIGQSHQRDEVSSGGRIKEVDVSRRETLSSVPVYP